MGTKPGELDPNVEVGDVGSYAKVNYPVSSNVSIACRSSIPWKLWHCGTSCAAASQHGDAHRHGYA